MGKKNNTKTWIIMILSFILMIVSTTTFSNGGLSLGKGIIYETKNLLSVMNNTFSDVNSDEIHNYLSQYNINLSVDEYIEESKEILEILSDANINISETAHIARFSATTLEGIRYNKNQEGTESLESLQKYDRFILILRTVSVILYILALLGIISIITSFIMMLFAKRKAIIFFLIMNILTCIVYIGLQIGIKNVNESLVSVLSSLKYGENTNTYLINSHISWISIISLIITIVTCVVWTYMFRQAYSQRMEVLSVAGLVKGMFSGRDTLTKNKSQKTTPRSVVDRFSDRCPHCNSMMKNGEQFCSNCGKKRPNGMEKTVNAGTHFCAFCGKKVSDESLFCPYCGQRDTGR